MMSTRERVVWEEGGAPTRGQSEGCTSEGILSMMMALPAFHHLQHTNRFSQAENIMNELKQEKKVKINIS